MFSEEILLRMGLDSRAVDAGITGVKAKLDSLAAYAKRTFASLFGAIGVSVVMNAMQKVFDYAERIQNKAQSWGVSAKFYQDITNVAKAAGIAEKSVENAFQKFRRTLPGGADAASEFYKFADHLASIQDPAERARQAVAKFGKTAEDILPILMNGSVELRRMASEYAYLTDEQLKQLNKAGDTVDKAKQTGLWGGSVALSGQFAQLDGINKILGAIEKKIGVRVDVGTLGSLLLTPISQWPSLWLSGGSEQPTTGGDGSDSRAQQFMAHLDDLAMKYGTDAEKLQVLTSRLEEAHASLSEATTDDEYYDRLEKVLDIQQELYALQAKTAKEQAAADKKALEAAEARAKIEEEIDNLVYDAAKKKQESYMPSLQEMADRPGPYQRIARQVLADRENAKSAFIAGNPELADRFINTSENGYAFDTGPRLVRGILGGGALGAGVLGGGAKGALGGLNFLRAMGVQPEDEGLKGLNQKIKSLVERAEGKGGGVVIVPQNGE